MSEPNEVGPALTPADWREVIAVGGPHKYDSVFESADDRQMHYLAALALHGQTFGFTHEDVDILRWVADLFRERNAGLDGRAGGPASQPRSSHRCPAATGGAMTQPIHHYRSAADDVAIIDRCGDVPIDLELVYSSEDEPGICPNCGWLLWIVWPRPILYERMPEPEEPSVEDWEPFCECGHPSKRHAHAPGRSYCREESCECIRFVRREKPPEAV